MPGGDRTGPGGSGPMTGRAAGYCAGYSVSGYMNVAPGRGLGRGYGFGRGLGRGFGRGMGRGFLPNYAAPYYQEPIAVDSNPQAEAQYLKEQAKMMQTEIDSMNKRIKELEAGEKTKG